MWLTSRISRNNDEPRSRTKAFRKAREMGYNNRHPRKIKTQRRPLHHHHQQKIIASHLTLRFPPNKQLKYIPYYSTMYTSPPPSLLHGGWGVISFVRRPIYLREPTFLVDIPRRRLLPHSTPFSRHCKSVHAPRERIPGDGCIHSFSVINV
jgi:hypothetical protein